MAKNCTDGMAIKVPWCVAFWRPPAISMVQHRCGGGEADVGVVVGNELSQRILAVRKPADARPRAKAAGSRWRCASVDSLWPPGRRDAAVAFVGAEHAHGAGCHQRYFGPLGGQAAANVLARAMGTAQLGQTEQADHFVIGVLRLRLRKFDQVFCRPSSSCSRHIDSEACWRTAGLGSRRIDWRIFSALSRARRACPAPSRRCRERPGLASRDMRSNSGG